MPQYRVSKRFFFPAAWLLAAVTLLAANAQAQSTIWVAVFDLSNGAGNGPKALTRILNEQAGFKTYRITPEEIRDGRLKSFDVLIMPGGSGSKQAEKLGEEGREIVKQFVRDGGGYMGICAGSYLASSDYTWSLHLLNAKVFDRAHWARGTGQVKLSLSPTARDLLKHDEENVEVYYGQGPLLIPDDKADLPAFETLASYESEIAKKGAPSGVMIGTTAIARAPYGEGRVICFSPHCEVTGGPNHMISAAVLWACKQEGRELPTPTPEVEAAAAGQQN